MQVTFVIITIMVKVVSVCESSMLGIFLYHGMCDLAEHDGLSGGAQLTGVLVDFSLESLANLSVYRLLGSIRTLRFLSKDQTMCISKVLSIEVIFRELCEREALMAALALETDLRGVHL